MLPWSLGAGHPSALSFSSQTVPWVQVTEPRGHLLTRGVHRRHTHQSCLQAPGLFCPPHSAQNCVPGREGRAGPGWDPLLATEGEQFPGGGRARHFPPPPPPPGPRRGPGPPPPPRPPPPPPPRAPGPPPQGTLAGRGPVPSRPPGRVEEPRGRVGRPCHLRPAHDVILTAFPGGQRVAVCPLSWGPDWHRVGMADTKRMELSSIPRHLHSRPFLRRPLTSPPDPRTP